jgi:hypothetical protein
MKLSNWKKNIRATKYYARVRPKKIPALLKEAMKLSKDETETYFGDTLRLLEETNKIMKAQQARGADFESGGPVKRAKAMVPILIPLFVSSFRRAGELAEAMEARCYHGGNGRTKMKPLKYHLRDLIAYLALIGLIVGCIFIP